MYRYDWTLYTDITPESVEFITDTVINYFLQFENFDNEKDEEYRKKEIQHDIKQLLNEKYYHNIENEEDIEDSLYFYKEIIDILWDDKRISLHAIENNIDSIEGEDFKNLFFAFWATFAIVQNVEFKKEERQQEWIKRLKTFQTLLKMYERRGEYIKRWKSSFTIRRFTELAKEQFGTLKDLRDFDPLNPDLIKVRTFNEILLEMMKNPEEQIILSPELYLATYSLIAAVGEEALHIFSSYFPPPY